MGYTERLSLSVTDLGAVGIRTVRGNAELELYQRGAETRSRARFEIVTQVSVSSPRKQHVVERGGGGVVSLRLAVSLTYFTLLSFALVKETGLWLAGMLPVQGIYSSTSLVVDDLLNCTHARIVWPFRLLAIRIINGI